MKLGRNVRILAGIVVLLGAGVVLSPHATSHVSHSAVVNAPVVAVHSPFEGRLVSRPHQPGEAISPGDTILSLVASRGSRTEIARLDAEVARLRREKQTLVSEMESLQALDRNLQLRQAAIVAFAERALELRHRALAAELDAKRVEAGLAHGARARFEELSKRGALASATLERARADADRADLLVDQLTAELARVDHDLGAVRAGMLPAVGSEDGSYAQQRRDEISIRIADLSTRRDVIDGRIHSARSEVAALRAEQTRLERFEPTSERGAIVWSAGPAAGASVAVGDELISLLDCSRRFLEVVVSESALGAISAGDKAWVRQTGAAEPFLAVVHRIRGGGAEIEAGRLAARPVRLTGDSISVMLQLPDVDIEDPAMKIGYCDVGRSAEVRFARQWETDLARRLTSWQEDFARLWRVARYAFGAGLAYAGHVAGDDFASLRR